MTAFDRTPDPDETRDLDESPDPDELRALLDRARSAAELAGQLLLERPDDLGTETKTTVTDVVTVMDQRSEALLTSLLLADREGDGILGEEGASRNTTSGYRWVIDPIDGTVNYLYGLPGWSVSVGLEFHGVPVLGVVAVPTYAVTYFGAKGLGAYAVDGSGERPLRPSTVTDLSMALTGTGFGYAASRRKLQAAVLAEFLPEIRDIRRAGSAAVDICWVCDGKLDAYFEKGLNPWDFTAAAAIAAEAGVQLAGIDGRGPNHDLTIAANPVLFGQFHDRLKELGAHDPDE